MLAVAFKAGSSLVIGASGMMNLMKSPTPPKPHRQPCLRRRALSSSSLKCTTASTALPQPLLQRAATHTHTHSQNHVS